MFTSRLADLNGRTAASIKHNIIYKLSAPYLPTVAAGSFSFLLVFRMPLTMLYIASVRTLAGRQGVLESVYDAR